MSGFTDLGRKVLHAMITTSLGDVAEDVDVEAAVNAFVEKWGFVDLDEVPEDEYWKLVRRYADHPVE